MGNKESHEDNQLTTGEQDELSRSIQGLAQLQVRALRFSILELASGAIEQGYGQCNILMVGQSHIGKSSFIRLMQSAAQPVRKLRPIKGPLVASGTDGSTTRQFRSYPLGFGCNTCIYDMIGVNNFEEGREVIFNAIAGYLMPNKEIAGSRPSVRWLTSFCVFFQAVVFCVPAVETRLENHRTKIVPLGQINDLLQFAGFVHDVAERQGSKVFMLVTKMDLFSQLDATEKSVSNAALKRIYDKLKIEDREHRYFEVSNYAVGGGSSRDFIQEVVALQLLHSANVASVNCSRGEVLKWDEFKY